jgi:hypothetical protein
VVGGDDRFCAINLGRVSSESWQLVRPNLSVNTDARRRGFALAGVAGYLTRWASRRSTYQEK